MEWASFMRNCRGFSPLYMYISAESQNYNYLGRLEKAFSSNQEQDNLDNPHNIEEQ
jgi:hypothetical protein